MTIPGGRKDLGVPSARATVRAAQPVEQTTPISGQHCLPVAGAQRPEGERRCSARTQLGMPAWRQTSPEPSSAAPARVTNAVPPAPRHGPPPLPAHLGGPKVIVAAAPLPSRTLPARRLQLQDVTCDLATADRLQLRSAAPPAPRHGASVPRRAVAAPHGVRGLLVKALTRLLSLLSPSLQAQPSRLSSAGGERRSLRRQRDS